MLEKMLRTQKIAFKNGKECKGGLPEIVACGDWHQILERWRKENSSPESLIPNFFLFSFWSGRMIFSVKRAK